MSDPNKVQWPWRVPVCLPAPASRNRRWQPHRDGSAWPPRGPSGRPPHCPVPCQAHAHTHVHTLALACTQPCPDSRWPASPRLRLPTTSHHSAPGPDGGGPAAGTRLEVASLPWLPFRTRQGAADGHTGRLARLPREEPEASSCAHGQCCAPLGAHLPAPRPPGPLSSAPFLGSGQGASTTSQLCLLHPRGESIPWAPEVGSLGGGAGERKGPPVPCFPSLGSEKQVSGPAGRLAVGVCWAEDTGGRALSGSTEGDFARERWRRNVNPCEANFEASSRTP